MRKLLLATVLLLVLPIALAQEEITIQGSMNEAIKAICPSGDILKCPPLDFVVAFGVVFAVLFLAFNMVEQFSSAGDEAKKALNAFAALAGFATAIYVYVQQIPFLAVISTVALFIVGIMIILVLSNLVTSRERGTGMSWGTKLALIGIGLLALGILLSYYGQYGPGSILMFIGFIILVIGMIWGLVSASSGGGTPPNPDEPVPPPHPDEPVPPPHRCPAGQHWDEAQGKCVPDTHDDDDHEDRLDKETKKYLLKVIALLKKIFADLALDENELLRLFNLLEKLGVKNAGSSELGIFGNLKGSKNVRTPFKKLFLGQVKPILARLRKDEKTLISAEKLLITALKKCKGFRIEKNVRWILTNLKIINSQLDKAEKDFEVLNNYIKKTSKVWIGNLGSRIYDLGMRRTKSLKGILLALRYLMSRIIELENSL